MYDSMAISWGNVQILVNNTPVKVLNGQATPEQKQK